MSKQEAVSPDSTSMDKDDRVLAALSSIGFVGFIVYFFVDSSIFVKHYAKQGTVLLLLSFVLQILPWFKYFSGLIVIIGTVVLGIHALQEEKEYRLPLVSDIADKLL